MLGLSNYSRDYHFHRPFHMRQYRLASDPPAWQSFKQGLAGKADGPQDSLCAGITHCPLSAKARAPQGFPARPSHNLLCSVPLSISSKSDNTLTCDAISFATLSQSAHSEVLYTSITPCPIIKLL